MRLSLRLVLACSVIAAMAGGMAVAGGCAAKPVQAEPASAVAPAQAAAKPAAGHGAPAGGGTASGDTSPGGAGVSVTSGGGASADSSSPPSGSATPLGRVQTSDERKAALDKRLSDSLGSFDAKLRTEQQKIAQERDARQATVSTAAASDGADKSAGEQSGDATGKRTGSRSAGAGDLKSEKPAGGANGSSAGNGAVANEIPDGNDDDIVARRLRKAAEQETDPELKDKLWKEYVEYKKNTPGK